MTSNEINVDEIKSFFSGCYVHNIPMLFVSVVYDEVNIGTDNYHIKERLVLGKVKDFNGLDTAIFHIPLTEYKRHIKNNTMPSHYE